MINCSLYLVEVNGLILTSSPSSLIEHPYDVPPSIYHVSMSITPHVSFHIIYQLYFIFSDYLSVWSQPGFPYLLHRVYFLPCIFPFLYSKMSLMSSLSSIVIKCPCHHNLAFFTFSTISSTSKPFI